MASIARPRSRGAFEIALLCVLKPERDAIELALDEQYETDGFSYGRAPSDQNIYTTGRFGIHPVVLVYLPEMGNSSSAAAAANIHHTFPGIKLALVVGVCGVNPQAGGDGDREILLGDVVISTTVIRPSYGRQYSDALRLKTRVEDTLGRASPQIRSFLNRLDGISALRRLEQKIVAYSKTIVDQGLRERGAYPGPENDKLYPPEYRHKHQDPKACDICAACQGPTHEVCQTAMESSCATLGCDDTILLPRKRLLYAMGYHPDGSRISDVSIVEAARRPSIFFERVASGEFVLRSAYHRDKLAREHDVIAFEMEGAGAWDYLPTIIVKGASDYADSHKNKSWQQYSAITAAACAKALVEEWRMVQHNPDTANGTSSTGRKRRLSSCSNRGRRDRERQNGQDELMEDIGNVTSSSEGILHARIRELGGIPHAVEASFDSQALETTRACLENTRVALMQDIYQWATTKDSQPIFWLQGIAGTGKTTVAKTVARTFSEQNSLGASFFFS